MGIRFLCPNGHKLNVKSELAGRRALCPECGAKLRVPSGYDGSAAELPMASSAELPVAMPSGIVTLEPEPVAPAAAPVVTSAATMAAPPASVWYVRPKSGGQYGPATEEVFRMWIREGRVAADAHVWRDGWSDWKLARDAGDVLPAPLASLEAESGSQGAWPVYGATELAAEPPQVVAVEPVVAPIEDQDAKRPASRYLADRRRANKRQVTIAVLMLLAILVLAGVLAWVLLRSEPAVETTTTRQTRPIQLAEPHVETYVAGIHVHLRSPAWKQRT